MAKKAKKKQAARPATKVKKSSPGASLGLTFFAVLAVLVAATAASAVVASLLGQAKIREAVADALSRTNAAQAVLQQKRYQDLERIAQVVTAETDVVSRLTERLAVLAGDRPPPPPRPPEADETLSPLEALLAEIQSRYTIDRVAVFGPRGELVAAATANAVVGSSTPATADAPGDDTPENPLITVAREKNKATGLREVDGVLHHALVVQLVRDFELLGFFSLSTTVEPLASELGRTTGSTVVLWRQSATGPEVVASTDRQRGDAVIGALRREGQGLSRVGRGETVEEVEIELDGAPWIGFLVPLRNAANEPVGAIAALEPIGDELAVFTQLQLLVGGVAGIALVLGFILSMLLARRAFAPVRRIADATAELAGGHWDVEFPKIGGIFRDFVAPLEGLARRLQDRREIENYLSRAARGLPEPARGSAASGPAAGKLALLAVEMRRFAHPKLAFDPEEHAGRYAHDLRRIQSTVAARRGTLEAVLGHRLLITFDGEDNASRSLAAATEILLLLTTRENAFDEPSPPVLALTKGPVVTGSVVWSGQQSGLVAGLPVQQLESLLREAAPGEITLSKPFTAELAEAIKSSGVKVRSQRGLVSPQPLYVFDEANAKAFCGVTAPPSPEEGASQALTLADVTPGEVLGERFEIEAELDAHDLGPIWKARDRERGELVRFLVLRPEMRSEAPVFEHLKASLGPTRFLNHPATVPTLDFAEINGLVYVSATFARGMSVRFLLSQGQRIPASVAYLLGRKIAEALTVAHGAKAVHGGLRPESVLVEPTGEVHLVDFGLTPPVDPSRREVPSTVAPYLAPEQLVGRAGDVRSDLFGWGALFYEMVTGRPPAAGATPAAIAAARQQNALELPTLHCPDLPPTLEQIILRCLSEKPEERYGTAEALLRELDALRG